MTTHDSTRLLRYSLRANAAFSTLSGILFAAKGARIATFLGGVTAADVTSVGVSLLAFAAGLLWLSRQAPIPEGLVRAVIAADLAWVVGTGAAVAAGVFSGPGNTAALLVADVVLVFAVLQGLGLRRVHALAHP